MDDSQQMPEWYADRRVSTGITTREAVMRGKHEPVQLICPKCRHRMIVYLPLADDEDLPICPECKQARMNIEELLDEGKSY